MMNHHLAACVLALAAALPSAPALAAAVSYVSVRGTDTGNNCAAIATPCRTFAHALGQTDAHGEIFAIAPGNYGPVIINKSISITGTVDGAGINTASAGSPFHQILIGAGADLVYLTGLTLDGGATPADTTGVAIDFAGRLIIRKCAIRNYSGTGRGVGKFGSARLLLEEVAISNANTNIENLNGPAIIHRVVSNQARRAAILSIVSSGAASMISETSLSGNATGVSRGNSPSAVIFLTRSEISGNSTGVDAAFGSAVNNLIRGNGASLTGTITNIGTK